MAERASMQVHLRLHSSRQHAPTHLHWACGASAAAFAKELNGERGAGGPSGTCDPGPALQVQDCIRADALGSCAAVRAAAAAASQVPAPQVATRTACDLGTTSRSLRRHTGHLGDQDSGGRPAARAAAIQVQQLLGLGLAACCPSHWRRRGITRQEEPHHCRLAVRPIGSAHRRLIQLGLKPPHTQTSSLPFQAIMPRLFALVSPCPALTQTRTTRRAG